MTQQINIDKAETITISNSTFGDITVTLNDVGEYVVVSNGPPVAVQQTSLEGGFKQQYVGGKGARVSDVSQTAFSNVRIKGNLTLKTSQSIG